MLGQKPDRNKSITVDQLPMFTVHDFRQARCNECKLEKEKCRWLLKSHLHICPECWTSFLKREQEMLDFYGED